MGGSTVEAPAPAAVPEVSAPVVSLAGVVKEYRTGRGVRRVLDGIDLEVGRGRFVALMGPSGSGKSTLLHLVGGLLSPDEGTALADLGDVALAVMRRHKVGFVFQSYNLVPVLSAAENVGLPLAIAGRSAGTDAARVAACLDAVGLGDGGDALPAELSGGEQQRVAIARAMVMEPAVLLADEPTGNLDSEMATQVLLTIKEVQAATGQTVLLATHDVHTAAFADEVVLLRDGRIADRLCLEGWSVPEALAVSEGRFGDDRMRVVLSWLRGEAPEPRRRRPTRR